MMVQEEMRHWQVGFPCVLTGDPVSAASLSGGLLNPVFIKTSTASQTLSSQIVYDNVG